MYYQFPRTTCEMPQSGVIKQPVSSAINMLTVFGLVVLLIVRKYDWASGILVLSLVLFELWHTLSHAIHMKNNIQAIGIHTMAYIIAICIGLLIFARTGSISLYFVWFAVFMDILVISLRKKIGNHWSVITGIIIIGTLLVENYNKFPNSIQEMFPYFALMFVLGVICFLLETFYCQAAMNKKQLPYHAIVEIIVLVFTLTFANAVLMWK